MNGDLRGYILIIDDEEDFALTLASRLELRGVCVRCAFNGEQGLAILRERTPGLVLLDMRMPGLNGVEVLRVLRNDGDIAGGKDLPVFLVSGHASEEDFDRAKELGIQGCFTKPLNFAELWEAVSLLPLRLGQEYLP